MATQYCFFILILINVNIVIVQLQILLNMVFRLKEGFTRDKAIVLHGADADIRLV